MPQGSSLCGVSSMQDMNKRITELENTIKILAREIQITREFLDSEDFGCDLYWCQNPRCKMWQRKVSLGIALEYVRERGIQI